MDQENVPLLKIIIKHPLNFSSGCGYLYIYLEPWLVVQWRRLADDDILKATQHGQKMQGANAIKRFSLSLK